jgi:aspartate 1-decarboxylase
MKRCMLRSKIHSATITQSDLSYEGSITIDEELMNKADIRPFEQVQVSNLMNGERFETYAIPGKKGQVCLNGPTARKGEVGDRVMIFAYCWLDEVEVASHHPRIFLMGPKNKIKKAGEL